MVELDLKRSCARDGVDAVSAAKGGGKRFGLGRCSFILLRKSRDREAHFEECARKGLCDLDCAEHTRLMMAAGFGDFVRMTPSFIETNATLK